MTLFNHDHRELSAVGSVQETHTAFQDISAITKKQKAFFATGKTRDLSFRKDQLQKLFRAVKSSERKLAEAFKEDMNKSEFEAFATETGLVLKEIRYHLKHLKKWARPLRVPTPVIHFPAVSRILPEPYGSVLILSPWNYPLLLLFSPLIGAMSAGNCAVIKPSGRLPALNRVFSEIIGNTFPPEYIALFSGGHQISNRLLEEPFDHIFFTGSKQTGKKVMAAAARQLIPVTLELGGKNPCIVHQDAHLKSAARRIIWGKFINAGQTCIAPDYLLVHKDIKDLFVRHLIATLQEFYGEHAENTGEFTHMTGRENVLRMQEFIAEGKVLYGGLTDPENNFVAPTLLDGVRPGDKVMEDEIFGPVLPLLEYGSMEEMVAIARRHPDPLALYLFSSGKHFVKEMLEKIPSGTVAINDTVSQFVNEHLPFGGIRQSGIGAYHGKFSFDTFSHHRSLLRRGTWLDIPLRYPPYSAKKLKWIKKFLK